jgi:tetratricopeptide (TPR) repeat protein
MRRGAALLCAAVLAGALPGVAGAQAPDVAPFLAKRESEGERNRVLNDMEIGARAFWYGDLESARSALDETLTGINTVYANDPAAEKARSLWYAEGSKNFKGEPYERAMAFFYRGLLFLAEGDYQNARAAARQGLLQDAFAEDDQTRADFALLMFLDAWASHLDKNKDLTEQALKELRNFRPNFPGIKPGDDTLILVETGTAPRKVADGMNHSYYVIRRGRGFTENRAQMVMNGVATPLYPMEDIYYQAATRGGRPVDQILKGKAKFRDTTGGAGNFLLGSAVAFQDAGANLGTAGYVVGGLGAMSAFMGSRANAEADTRFWSALPDTIHVMTMSSKDIPPDGVTFRFLANDAPVAGIDKTVKIKTDPEGNHFIFVRSR